MSEMSMTMLCAQHDDADNATVTVDDVEYFTNTRPGDAYDALMVRFSGGHTTHTVRDCSVLCMVVGICGGLNDVLVRANGIMRDCVCICPSLGAQG